MNRVQFLKTCHDLFTDYDLNYETLKVENHNLVGSRIAGGGLTDRELKQENVKFFLENNPIHFLPSDYFHIVFDANGNLIHDSKDRFKTMANQQKYMNADKARYVTDILDAIKANYEKSDLALLQDEDDFFV